MSEYPGQERRQFCQSHIALFSDLAVVKEKVLAIDKRINGSIDDIHDHIKSGGVWRAGIVGVAGMFIIQLLVLANMWGKLCRTVEINTNRLDKMENKSAAALK